MKILQVTVILSAITLAAVAHIIIGKNLSAGRSYAVLEAPAAAAAAAVETTGSIAPANMLVASLREPLPRELFSHESLAREPLWRELSPPVEAKTADDPPYVRQASLEEEPSSPVPDYSPAPVLAKERSYLGYYVYAEFLPDKKPAEIALETVKGVAIGPPIEEIKRAADLFGLDFNFMKTVAKIESDFDPKQRTGQYVGLFQLNKYEFGKYGSGDIMSPRDNSIAAAFKFLTEATLFQSDTHREPTFSDLYLIHQQGWQGAAEHVGHPERIAWKSMCATDEGREKGEKWCKRAIWANTLPDIKRVWKSVDKLTSSAFVAMWRERVEHLYARYSSVAVEETKR
jgi:hypothetical protein